MQVVCKLGTKTVLEVCMKKNELNDLQNPKLRKPKLYSFNEVQGLLNQARQQTINEILTKTYGQHGQLKRFLMADVKHISKDKQYQRGYRHGHNQYRRDLLAELKP